MQKKTVLEEALADAKQLKAMAIEQAKLSLHESVTPEIEKLLSQRLSEDFEEDEDEEDESPEPKKESAQPDELKKSKKDPMAEIAKLGLDETTLAAISKALGESSQDEDSQDEDSQDKDSQDKDEQEVGKTESLDLDAALAEIEGLQEEDEECDDPNKDDEVDEALDIDAILAEMDEDQDEDEDEDEDEDKGYSMNEEYGDDTYEAGKTAEKGKVISGSTNDKGLFTKDHIVILKDILSRAERYEAGKTAQKGKTMVGSTKVTVPTGSKVIAKTQLQEAQIAKLSNELKDLNLFAAKNLYLNKVLVLPNLTESHKAKAIAAFDKVKTVDAAKNVFEVLKSAITATPSRKSNIAESLGFKQRTETLNENAKTSTQIQYLPQADAWKKRAGIKD